VKKLLSVSILISLCFLIPTESSARKRKRLSRSWSISTVNGYSFYQIKKPSAKDPTAWGNLDGQMHKYFSALEISRNMGYYEFGARIQNLGYNFVTPFMTWNMMKNNYKTPIVTSFSLGVTPSHIAGLWLRFNLALSINRYISLSPFIGAYVWYKTIDDPEYEKQNIHLNAGLQIKLFR